MLESKTAVCTHAYLISYTGAKNLLKVTMPMKHAVDEKLRAASQKGIVDSRSVCPPISRQPWQNRNEMWRDDVPGETEFSWRGGNATDFPLFMEHLQHLSL